MTSELRVVNNRVFLLGLDHLYREAMKAHERQDLLWCARSVAGELGMPPAEVPLEGYYAEDEQLAEYFRLMRGLQAQDGRVREKVASMPPFQRLHEIAAAPLFGRPQDTGKLLPVGRDPLSQALRDTWPAWTIDGLTEAACRAASENDDISLVGLAARARDAVVLAATRESVVLYAEKVIGGAVFPKSARYSWEVDEDLAGHARRFVDTFNRLFDENLPQPVAANAAWYWSACHENRLHGRCVQLGFDDRTQPVTYYHWALLRDVWGNCSVRDFWADEVWTTSRYQTALLGLRRDWPPAAATRATPVGAGGPGQEPPAGKSVS